LTQSELVAAFNDKNVSNIVMASSSWNFTDEELPLNGIILSGKHRNVVLEGKTFPDGKQTYVDVSRYNYLLLCMMSYVTFCQCGAQHLFDNLSVFVSNANRAIAW
jgi:hypothetical protein